MRGTTIASGLIGVVFGLATTSSLQAVEPPAAVVEALSSERYPERIAAENALKQWALESGSGAKEWLLQSYQKQVDPESRRRFLTVLKETVLTEKARERPGFVGVTMSPMRLDDERAGVRINEVHPGTPADVAGLQVHDVIVSLDGVGWEEDQPQHEFAERIQERRGGDTVTLGIFRDGDRKEVALVLVPRPWSNGEYSREPRWDRNRRDRWDDSPSREKHAADQVFRGWLREQLEKEG